MAPDNNASFPPSKEISPQNWARIIQERGAAILHGQLNPYWFNNEEIPKPLHNTGYEDYGLINAIPTSTEIPGDPHGRIARIAEAVTKDNKRKETATIVLGPQVDQNHQTNTEVIETVKQMKDFGMEDKIPEVLLNEYSIWRAQEFNRLKLNGKMSGKWRKIEIEMYQAIQQLDTPNGPILSFRSNAYPLPMNMNIYLPEDEARNIFQDAQKNPNILTKIIGALYPKLFKEPYGLQLVKPDRLIAVESDGKSEPRDLLTNAKEITYS